MKIPKDLIRQHIENAVANLPTPKEENQNLFCPISLGDWLTLCKQTEVPFIQAELIATLEREDCLSFDTQGEHQNRLREAFLAINRAKLPFHMARLDCCAGIELKFNMARGNNRWIPSYGDIILDDPRAFDILLEYPRLRIPVWRRPWTEPMQYDSYPVEYRAFVNDGKIAGISSYYPQRPLIEFKGHLEQVRSHTEKLIEAVNTPFLWPLTRIPDGMAPEQVHFTADFMATSADIYFLEGGPPHEMGAHPCCFRPGDISGIALVDRNESPVH